MGTESETELLGRCRTGEAEAWDTVFEQHYAPLGRFVFQLGYDFTREDVEEVCQETFLTVIKNIGGFQGNCHFQTWLFKIGLNKARDYLQRKHAAKRGGGLTPISLHNSDAETGLAVDPPSMLPGPDLALIQNENLGLVGQAVAELSDPCREIIEMRYFADLSYEEIAAGLNMNPKTVSSRLSKCLDKLEEVARALLSGEKKTPTAV
jgi:RNA polymerase sigma-70 factor (ECF subfamily)